MKNKDEFTSSIRKQIIIYYLMQSKETKKK